MAEQNSDNHRRGSRLPRAGRLYPLDNPRQGVRRASTRRRARLSFYNPEPQSAEGPARDVVDAADGCLSMLVRTPANRLVDGPLCQHWHDSPEHRARLTAFFRDVWSVVGAVHLLQEYGLEAFDAVARELLGVDPARLHSPSGFVVSLLRKWR